MIAEGIETFKRICVAAARPTTLRLGDRDFVYDDKILGYLEKERIVVQTGTVARVECLAELVLEEVRRRPEASAGGLWMTVIFDRNGAEFSPDDRERRDVYRYKRVLSAEWDILRKTGGQTYSHAEWIRLLQRLRPVMRDGREIVRAFRQLDVARAARVVSAPTLQEGKTGHGYQVDLLVRTTTGGETPQVTTIPSDLVFDVPFARGGEHEYELEAEVHVELVEEEGAKAALEFSLYLPDLDATEGMAIQDEVLSFREKTRNLEHLLILENF